MDMPLSVCRRLYKLPLTFTILTFLHRESSLPPSSQPLLTCAPGATYPRPSDYPETSHSLDHSLSFLYIIPFIFYIPLLPPKGLFIASFEISANQTNASQRKIKETPHQLPTSAACPISFHFFTIKFLKILDYSHWFHFLPLHSLRQLQFRECTVSAFVDVTSDHCVQEVLSSFHCTCSLSIIWYCSPDHSFPDFCGRYSGLAPERFLLLLSSHTCLAEGRKLKQHFLYSLATVCRWDLGFTNRMPSQRTAIWNWDKWETARLEAPVVLVCPWWRQKGLEARGWAWRPHPQVPDSVGSSSFGGPTLPWGFGSYSWKLSLETIF